MSGGVEPRVLDCATLSIAAERNILTKGRVWLWVVEFTPVCTPLYFTRNTREF
jgi:hypothetical protein